MCRSLRDFSFVLAMCAAAPAFAQQGLQTGQTGLQAGQPQQPGPLTAPPPSSVPRQGSNFDRVSTVRHQVTVGPPQTGRGAAAQQPVTSLGQTQRASRPLSVQNRSSAHAFYPGMRGSQSPNMNVPQYRSRNSRSLYPGMFMNSGMGRTGAARSPGKTGR